MTLRYFQPGALQSRSGGVIQGRIRFHHLILTLRAVAVLAKDHDPVKGHIGKGYKGIAHIGTADDIISPAATVERPLALPFCLSRPPDCYEWQPAAS
jgi:hypothetical protein